MAKRRQPPKPLKRRTGFRQPKKTLVVFCEGTVTEPEYLDALKKLPEVREVAAVDIHVQHAQGGAVPMTLVGAAVEAKKRADQEEGEIDEFWCVFDVEWPKNHPDLDRAVTLAKDHGIDLAISNPCFEIWLALHLADHSSWCDNNEARRIRHKLDGHDDKSLDPNTYMPRRADAVRRARTLDSRHEGNDTKFPNNNPSSGMHRLVVSVDPSIV